MAITKEDLLVLTEPFEQSKVCVKVQSLSKARDKALLVLYLQHTDVYERLEKVDPSWSATALEVRDVKRDSDTLIIVRMKLTLKGVERENVGEGYDEKSAYSDALKRVAMLFGIGRYLYDQDMCWVQYNEQSDRYKTWSYEEYEKAIGKKKAATNSITSTNKASPGSSKSDNNESGNNQKRHPEFIIPIGTHKGKDLSAFSKPDALKWLKQILAAQSKGKAQEKEWTTVTHKLMEYTGYIDTLGKELKNGADKTS